MKKKHLVLENIDNVGIALYDMDAGEEIIHGGESFLIKDKIPQKHKFALTNLPLETNIVMYGQIVGKTQKLLERGQLLTYENITNKTGSYTLEAQEYHWTPPQSKITETHFLGYPRKDGQVGTDNVWLVFPLVFCENRTVEIVKESLEHALETKKSNPYERYAETIWKSLQSGEKEIQDLEDIQGSSSQLHNVKLRFLSHQTGCGGTRGDARMLCKLLAGYLNNPNVAGASILSLGCQNAQESMLKEEIDTINKGFDKPLLWFNHQKEGKTDSYIKKIIEKTLMALKKEDTRKRQPSPLSQLTIGVECGGSDGFSGISANPVVGKAMDLIVALGGKVILSEFPELAGTESEIIRRSVDTKKAQKFVDLMARFEKKAQDAGSGFKDNPSPGNIREGLITDAMKSAGAVRKGGTSPVNDVLDYGEYVKEAGLSLLCTPGNDVESTTAMAGSGANIILFTTGLGTPTGNPVAPVLKISSNTAVAQKMDEIIDFNTGTVLNGEHSIEEKSLSLVAEIIAVASGQKQVKADSRGQHDFIPWKRDISL